MRLISASLVVLVKSMCDLDAAMTGEEWTIDPLFIGRRANAPFPAWRIVLSLT
jgi:hypothetical protein